MRSTLSLVLVAALMGTAGAAMAQNTGYVPTTQTSAPALYNTGEAAAPMIAGKNAPSYSSPGAAQPYAFGSSGSQGDTSGFGTLTPEQATAARTMRDQQAAQAQKEYMEMMQNGGLPPDAEGFYQNTKDGFSNMIAPEEEPKPKKRRVVYNQRNNDSAMPAPPRLFNPDQR